MLMLSRFRKGSRCAGAWFLILISPGKEFVWADMMMDRACCMQVLYCAAILTPNQGEPVQANTSDF